MVLNWLDYAVIAGYVLALTAFGTYFARFQRSSKDYFLTGHSVPWWAICFTIVATETSTITFIGVPAAAYTGNMAFLQLPLGYVIGRVIVSALFLPAYFRGDLMTSYQLLEWRFGPAVRSAGAAIFLVTRSLADGIRLFTTALVIAVVTGIPVPWTVVLLGTRDDRLHDVRRVGGGHLDRRRADVRVPRGRADHLLRAAERHRRRLERRGRGRIAAGKFAVFDFSLDFTKIYTFWAGLVGGVALTLATHGTDQFLVQRLLSAPSARDAGRGLILSGVLVLLQFGLFLVIGVMLFTYYQQVAAAGARAAGRDPAALRHQHPAERRGRLHRRRHRRGGAVAVDQRDGRDDGQRLLSALRQRDGRRADDHARVLSGHARLGHRPVARGARLPVDGPVGARRRPVDPVADRRARCSAPSSSALPPPA